MKYLILLFTLCSAATALSQTATLKGIVYEEMNGRWQPVTGANVYWNGTTSGVATDANGKFEIQRNTSSNKLTVSFIGYTTKTVEIQSDESNIEVLLSQDVELGEVTVASRQAGAHMQRSNPFTTVQITSAELGKAACCTLAESFETNASVDVSYTDAATGAKKIQLLGLSGTYVQMLTENMITSRGLASSFGLDFVPGSWMESIQVSKGAASVSNGYESLTGQINLQYKKPLTSEKFYANGFASSSGRIESNVNGGIKLNEKWSTAILAHASSDTQKNDHNNDGFLDEPLTVRYNFMNRWQFNPNDQWITQFGVKVLDEQRTGGQTAFDRKKESDKYGITIDSRNVEAFFKTGYIFSGDETKSAAIMVNYTGHNQESMYGHNFYNGKQNYLQANLILQSHFGNSERHRYNTGLSFTYDSLEESSNLYFPPFNPMVPQISIPNWSRSEKVGGAYFQYTFNIPDKFTFIAGLRGDYHNIFGSFVTPRVHIRYNITEFTLLRASAGKGYRTPDVMAEYNPLLASSRTLILDSFLKQEEGWNYGANITQYISIGQRELAVNMEYYHTRFVNQLIMDLDRNVNEVHFYNLDGKSYSNIFQVEASMEVVRGLDVVAAWRLNDVMTTTAGKLQRKAFQSRYKGLLNLSYATPLHKWQFDFTGQFNGAGRIPSTIGNPAAFRRSDTFNPYQIYNAQITKFFRTWNVYVGVENIGNFTQHNPIIDAENPFGEYFDSSLVWGPLMGRMFYFGFRFAIDRE
ncbi:MAG: TonB-dependent receptor [Cytophagaceae bacterium]|jgi:outer membrane receptor for ferrienterochelin and colicin|nr:TonB-dependent receptor [Cytophagaceae bacterium]